MYIYNIYQINFRPIHFSSYGNIYLYISRSQIIVSFGKL